MIMAQLKQLSAGSSQIIMMMFRDKNNAPIKADSVHVKGSIFTGSGKPFEFEVNKGVCTNCKIQNDMLLFNIVPLLGLGQMQVYTQTFLGDASYRYTYNKTAGNIPLGIKKGLALVSNNNAWADPGASDPNKVQGDLLAEADGIITIQYSGQAYNETSTINEANFWAAKVAPDGSLTEVPNSRYSTTIEANRKIAKNIQSKSISFPIQQGESVRFLANSNIDDGFYLQSGTDGKPLFEVIINFKEMVGMPFIPDELEKGATEFYE